VASRDSNPDSPRENTLLQSGAANRIRLMPVEERAGVEPARPEGAKSLAGILAYPCRSFRKWRRVAESNSHPEGAPVFKTGGRPSRPYSPCQITLVPGERFELVTNCVLSAAPLPVGLTGYMDRGSGVEPDSTGFASQPLADQDATAEINKN
jgi:hypothetical protein